MKRYGKFVALIVVVLGAMVYLAVAGGTPNATYYKTIAELGQMGHQAYGKKLRVGGDVESGSIQRTGGQVTFVLKQDDKKITVAYAGSDPLPDTLKDGAQALADGKLGTDGIFRAAKVQAKCASKYEAEKHESHEQQALQNHSSSQS